MNLSAHFRHTTACAALCSTLPLADELPGITLTGRKHERDQSFMTHAPVTYWLTGLPGAGKTTLAEALAQSLRNTQQAVCVLDGDMLRAGVNQDLGFSAVDRETNVQRTAHLARLLNEQGITAIVALISPTRTGRAAARDIISPGRFIEIHINTPLAICQQRDPKGLYARAQQDSSLALTGLQAPYEAPEQPALRINTHETPLADAVRQMLQCHARISLSP